jgi:hypothetical protein
VIEFCDGWMPNYGRYDFDGGVALLHEMLTATGRSPDSIELGLTSVPRDAAIIDELAQKGVARLVFSLRPDPPDELLRDLDTCAELIERFA